MVYSTVRALGPQEGVDNQESDEREFDRDVRPHSSLRLSGWGFGHTSHDTVAPGYYIHRGNVMPPKLTHAGALRSFLPSIPPRSKTASEDCETTQE